MRVAESTVILAPIFQVGWLSACSTVTCARSAADIRRKGPPEAVRRMRCTSVAIVPDQALEHRAVLGVDRQAGNSRGARRRAVMRLPPSTSVSLLASATVLPDRMAAMVGRSPAPPTMADSTTSASTSPASVTRPAAPRRISGCGRAGGAPPRPPRPGSAQREGARAVLEAQIGHELGIGSARGQPLHAELAGELVHQLERPAPYRARRAQENQPLHSQSLARSAAQ